jgi:hypothetical protein
MSEPAPAAIPRPQAPPSMIGTMSSQQLLEALDLAVQMTWSIEAYERMAGAEKTHVTRITKMKQMFTEAAAANQRGTKKLRDDTVELALSWHDKNFQPSFESPVDSYMTQLKASSDKLGGDAQPGAGHLSALTALERDIPTTYDAINGFLGTNKTEKDNLRSLRQALADAIKASQPASGTETLVANSLGRLMDADTQGFDALQKLDTSLANAADLVKGAVDGHTLIGPAAGSAPGNPKVAPSGPGGPAGGPSAQTPGGGPSAEQPGGQQPGGEQPGGQQPGGEQPGGEQPGGEQPGGEQPGGEQPGGETGTPPDDTGLSGMPTTTVPPPTTPDLPSPTPSTPTPSPHTSSPVPVGSSGGPSGLSGLGGVGPGGRSGGGSNPPGGGGNNAVQQAARQLTATPGAGTGQAPSLSGLGTGSSSARAGSGTGGMPPMMPPMMPASAGAGNGKPKPGTAQPTGTGRNRPPGASPGVPAGLRGRTGDGNAASRPASRRARRNGPEGVELLDSELWEVERPDPAAERAAERTERNEQTERMRMKGI